MGWRIPFLFGLAIGPVGFYIRKYIDEGTEFEKEEKTHTPVRDLLVTQKARVLLAVGALVISTAANYMILYMPTYAIKQLHLPAATGFAATLATGIVLTVLTPFVGHWSDTAGRVRIMAAAAVLMLATVYPTFVYMNGHPSFATMLVAMIWIGALKVAYFGALPALMSEIFPTRTRATGLAVSYNIGVTVFGGFAPLIITWLIEASGNKLAPGFYLMFCAVLSLIALYAVRAKLGIR